MRKLILAALLALAVPACKTEKAQMRTKTFMATYAASNASSATETCIAKRDGGAATDLKNAAKQCKAERAADPAAFATKYGTNKNGKNAYGKCVSAKARQASEQETQARVNAATSCKKLKVEQKAAFETAYGTKKNAFGKCVSKTAKAS
jgi:hypothetical protein